MKKFTRAGRGAFRRTSLSITVLFFGLLLMFAGNATAAAPNFGSLLYSKATTEMTWPSVLPAENADLELGGTYTFPTASLMFHDPAPTSIDVTILNTGGCSGATNYQFFLNGTNIGSAVSAGECSCTTPLQTLTISNAALLASAWVDGGPNTLRFTKTTGEYFSWIKMKANFPSDSITVSFDYLGGDATEPNLCTAGYTSTSFDQTLTATYYLDADGDGYGGSSGSITSTDLKVPVGYVGRGGDCNDANASAYPGAPELADGIDNDCNGVIDDPSIFYRDADGDGFGDKNAKLTLPPGSAQPAGYVTNSNDCNDTDPSITNNCKVLINGDTVVGGANSVEAQVAIAQGYQVTVVSNAVWQTMTQAQFGGYQLLIIGDPNCSSTPSLAAANAAVWAPVVMGTAGGRTLPGNRILIGTDPVLHGGNATSLRGAVIRTGIAYASKQPNRTGLYFDASCSGGGGTIITALNLLSTGTGTWTANSAPPCGGAVSLIASEPSFSTLTSASLAGWGCSVHETFPTFKSDWSALAVATDTATKPTCGVDPNTGASACGQAYVLIAGSSIVVTSGSISVAPLNATGPVNATHSVTAHVTSGGSPLVNQTITFTITGANAAAAGTCSPAGCKTNSSGDVTFTYTGTVVGDDTIKASFLDATGSNQAATAQKHWVNDRVQATATAPNDGGVYNGSPFTGSGSCSNGLSPVVTYSGGSAPINVGTTSYTVTCGDGGSHYIDGTATGSIVITKASSTTTVSCPSNVTFTGSAIEPCTASVTGAGGLSAAVTPVTYTTNTNAGTAGASATYGGDANHTGSTGTGGFTIDQASSTTTVSCPSNVTYTGSAIEPCTASVTGAGGLSAAVTPVTYTNNTNAGAASASATYGGDANHTGSTGTGGFTIDQASSYVLVTCPNDPQTYTGAAQTPCMASVSGAGGLTGSLPVTYSSNIDVGTAGATASYGGDANHTGSSSSSSFVISKAPTTVTVTANDATYDGNPHGGTAAVTGVNGLNESLVVTYVGRNLTTYAASTDAPTAAGDYTASASYAGSDNYSDSTGSKDYTIGKALSTTTVTCDAGPFVYSGSAFTPCSAMVTGDGGLSQVATVSYSNNTNAGTATASASFDGDANHIGSSGSAQFVIAKAEQSINFAAVNNTTFGASDFIINATATSGLTVSLAVVSGHCTLSSPTSPSNVHITGAGTCTITASQGGNGNFNAAADVTRTFSIARAAQVITFAPLANKTYGDADFNVSATGGGSGNAVTFTATGNCTVSGNTVHITAAGSCTITASQAGNDNYDPAADVSRSFNIAKAASAMTVSAPPFISNGGSATISGTLSGVSNAPLGGQTVIFTIGSGTGAQSCTATTTTLGTASCTIASVNQPMGPNLPVTGTFGGNSNYNGSGNSTTTFVYNYAVGAGGAFVIGDRNAAIGTNVTFWGAQWANLNSLTGGAAPSAFKGFANRSSTTPASSGATWTTDPGNSSNPPASIPAYMAVIVSSNVTKSGSIISGNTVKIVIVKTNAGYDANPGHAGTGTIVAVLP